MSFPRRKLPVFAAWLGYGLCLRALAALRGHLGDGMDLPPQSEFRSLTERRDG